MKKTNVLLILWLIPLSLFSQTVDIEWGEKYKTKGFGLSEIIGVDENGYSVLIGIDRQKIAKQKIITFNHEHTAVSEQKAIMSIKDRRTLPLKVITTSKKSYLISTHEGNSFELYATPLLNGSFGKTKSILNHEFTQKKKRLFSKKKKDIDLRFEFGLSQDKSTIVYTSELEKNDRDQEEEIVIAVFDENMEIRWKNKTKLPYKDKDFCNYSGS